MAKVLVYTTPTCVYCKMVKAFLKENNVEYTEKNVAEDAVAREEMVRESGQMGVPVVDIDGDRFVGFDKDWLKSKLGIK